MTCLTILKVPWETFFRLPGWLVRSVDLSACLSVHVQEDCVCNGISARSKSSFFFAPSVSRNNSSLVARQTKSLIKLGKLAFNPNANKNESRKPTAMLCIAIMLSHNPHLRKSEKFRQKIMYKVKKAGSFTVRQHQLHSSVCH